MVELAIGIAHVSILLGECSAAPPEIHGARCFGKDDTTNEKAH